MKYKAGVALGWSAPQTKIKHFFALKIISTVLKNDINILKQIVWETQKMALKFQ